jgi:hypothetical protein
MLLNPIANTPAVRGAVDQASEISAQGLLRLTSARPTIHRHWLSIRTKSPPTTNTGLCRGERDFAGLRQAVLRARACSTASFSATCTWRFR